MMLINRTKWSTAHLRKLCLAVIRHRGSHKNHRIEIKTKTRRYSEYHGRATVGGNWIMMNVPPIERTIKKGRYVAGEDGKMHLETKRVQDGNWLRTKVCYDYSNVTTLFDPITFARVLTHEIDHNLGMRHNSMARVGDLDCGYAEPFIVEPHRPAQKPRINRAEINRLRAEANLKRALMRFKRAQTILKKWQRKVSYYQSQALKSQQATPAPTLGGNGGGGEL